MRGPSHAAPASQLRKHSLTSYESLRTLRAMSFRALFVCVFFTFSLYAADVAKLDQLFDTLEQNQRLMGSVSLTRNGKVLYSRAFGFREQGMPANGETMYRVGSITKVFTAVMIYQLIDEKRLTLDTKLSRFFPRIANADQITIAQLLCHCSGIPSATPGEWSFEPQTKAQMLARFEALKPEYAPGEKSTYSNTNYALLGYIIEAVTRSSYDVQLKKRITRKLGLKRTRYGGAINPARNEARSFSWNDGKWNADREEHPSVPAGAGAMVSTPSELTRFMHALFTNRLMSAASVREMVTPYSGQLQGSEKGVAVFTLRGVDKRAYQHLGGIDGFMSNVTYLPEDGTALAISVNGFNYPINKVFRAIINTVYGQPATFPSFTPMVLPAETRARYAGVYALPQANMTFTIAVDGDQLTAQLHGQDVFPITAISETMFTHEPSGILIEFQPDGEAFMFHQGRGEGRFTRTPARSGT